MHERPSKLSNQEIREMFRDNGCHPLSITVCAIHDPTGLGLVKQNQASSYCLVCETEGDRF